jgi:Guanosine polyphosphate pyrophosphohydrolases/synthetases
VIGVEDVLVRLAKCCTPVPGDDIVGYISLGKGITIHRGDCPNVRALRRNPERFTPVEWEGGGSQSFRVQIAVDSWDRPRLLEDVRGRSPSTARTSSPTAAPSRSDGPELVRRRGRRRKALRGCSLRSATSTASSTPAVRRPRNFPRSRDPGPQPRVTPFEGQAPDHAAQLPRTRDAISSPTAAPPVSQPTRQRSAIPAATAPSSVGSTSPSAASSATLVPRHSTGTVVRRSGSGEPASGPRTRLSSSTK